MSRDRSTSRVLTGVACLAIGYGATVVAQGQGDGARAQAKIGVVDLGVLFKEYQRKDDLEASINGEREEMRKSLEADQQQLEKMREALDASGFVRGSEPWEREADKIKLEQHALELKQRRLQNALKKRVEEFTLQVLKELEMTIAAYGQRFQYTVILKVDDGEAGADVQGELGQQFQEQIFRAQISDVIFHDNAVDCTEGVLRLLNSPANIKRMERLAQGAPRGRPNRPRDQ